MTNEVRIVRMEKLLNEALNPTHLETIDESHKHIGHEGAKTGLGHFKVVIASDKFEGKSRIETHRMIYDALGDMMLTDVHALRIVVA